VVDHWTSAAENSSPLDFLSLHTIGAATDEGEPRGEPCYAWLDQASTSDLCVFVLFCPSCSNAILFYFSVSQETVNALEAKGSPSHATWKRQGCMRTTESNIANYDVICADIRELGELYDMRAIAADRWNVNQIITQLHGDRFNMV
jgi:phage terminase large subunit-like protein